MQFNSHLSEQRQRRYPVLSVFDATLNVVLCSGVFALSCAVLGVILTHNAPRVLGSIAQIVAQILR